MRIKPILFNTDMVKAILEGRKTVTRRTLKPQPQKEETNPHKIKSGNYFFDVPSIKFPGTLDRVVGPYRPPCFVGDFLWVRETWQAVYEIEWDEEKPYTGKNIRELIPNFDSIQKVEAGISSECSNSFIKPRMKYFVFKASDIKYMDNNNSLIWRPSIHMPKKAARIFLRVKDVRVERLQDITEHEAEKEGAEKAFEYNTTEDKIITIDEDGYFYYGFKLLWNRTINKKDISKYGWEANPYVWVIEFERCEKPENWPN